MQALPLATTTLTTIDPAVESAARARVEQPQHPEATIAITTAEFDPADRRRRERRRREAENGAVRRPVSAPQPRGRARAAPNQSAARHSLCRARDEPDPYIRGSFYW